MGQIYGCSPKYHICYNHSRGTATIEPKYICADLVYRGPDCSLYSAYNEQPQDLEEFGVPTNLTQILLSPIRRVFDGCGLTAERERATVFVLVCLQYLPAHCLPS